MGVRHYIGVALLCVAGLVAGDHIKVVVEKRPSPFLPSDSTQIVVSPEVAPTSDLPLTVTCDNPKVHVPKSFTFAAGRRDSVSLKVTGEEAGIASIKLLHGEDVVASFDVQVIKVGWLTTFNAVIGWIYFLAWSISFYPQAWENYVRKSVVGLSFDFLILNLFGWICYGSFNIGLFYVPTVQQQYELRHPGSDNPVQPNDVFFAIHAFILTAITIAQCFIYERGTQTVSYPVRLLVVLIVLFQASTLVSSLVGAIEALTFLTWLSFVKLGITLVKYMPQAYFNYARQSTVGWSIGNILLDFTGGTLSMLQMTLIAYNCNDWSGFLGNPTKFGLGLFSVAFDVLFILQHYVFYRHAREKDVEKAATTEEPTESSRLLA
eukprot:comp20371_c0_seq1/m.25740 comp20371_c0_seq1/g.25740  ORF comp20371_c0_seq1/g.25740 comp20371_c0_seq1/m.25740 type:complete len:377 (-) comp20371_c0_seq1:727-1857(-)